MSHRLTSQYQPVAGRFSEVLRYEMLIDFTSNMILKLEINSNCLSMGQVRSPLFVYMDTEIYPHLAPRYHARHSAARVFVVLYVDKLPYPRQQTGGN